MKMNGTAYLIVRAEVAEIDRDAFDIWYENEHLPDAHKAFGSEKAWRGWCGTDLRIHYAFYQFPTVDEVRDVLASDGVKTMVAEFDRVWGDSVKRTRETVTIQQSL